MTGIAAAGQGLEALYEQTARDVLHDASREGFEAVRMLEDARLNKLQPSSVEYPHSALGKSLSQIAQLIKSDVGLEIAFAESGGWDMHAQQGSTDGAFARRSGELAGALSRLLDRPRHLPRRRRAHDHDRVRPDRRPERIGRDRPRPCLLPLRPRAPT